jgi:hypothetical protein
VAKIINFFAGPGSGKSTLAAGLFYKMKQAGYNVELVTEYAKQATYERRHSTLKNQVYILGKQFNRIEMLVGQVEYIVTDSPILLSSYYAGDGYPESLHDLVCDLHDRYSSLNYFVERRKKYSQVGRSQTEEEAIKVDRDLKAMLNKYGIFPKNITSDDAGIEEILEDVKSS